MRLAIPFVILVLIGPVLAQPPAEKKKPRNALAGETSLYLRMHAHNPTDWMPWGPAAFEKAKKEGKLVFLSIGYSSCYWCHVMERECFDNEAVAKALNADFVPLYSTILLEPDPPEGDVVVLASGSAARAYAWIGGAAPAISIGPETSKVAGSVGIDVAIEAQTHDLDGLLAAVEEYAGRV